VDDALVELLGADDLVTRALAADAAGRIIPRHDCDAGAVVDALGARLDDPDPAVRRWAARSLGRVGAATDGDVPTAELTACLHDGDPVTRSYVLRALCRLAEADPDRLRDAVDAAVRALDDPDDAVRANAASTLALAPPEALTNVPAAPDHVVARFDDWAVEDRTVATLIGTLAEGDPAALRGRLDELVEQLHHPAVCYAVACVAARDPDAVRAVEDELVDADGNVFVRCALARIHSEHFPSRLRDELSRRPEALAEELATVVEYAVTAPTRERRRAVVEAVAETMGWRSTSLEPLFRRLVDALSWSEPGVRKNAAEAIRWLVEERDADADADADIVGAALPALLDRATADDWEVRSQALGAVEALVTAGWASVDVASVADVATRALGDDHGRARRRAARILGSLPDDRAADTYDGLVARRDTADLLARRGVTLALGHVAPAAGRNAEALTALDSAFTADDPWVRRNAVESATLIAEALDDPERVERVLASVSYPVRDTVRRTLSDRNPVVRAEGCRCLGVVGTDDDEDALVARTEDRNAKVRAAAMQALERLRERIGAV
jgi:hypothetical protein